MPASQQTDIVSGYYCLYAPKASQLLQQKQSFAGSKRDASEDKKLRIKMVSKCVKKFPDESRVQNQSGLLMRTPHLESSAAHGLFIA
jgi:hypothetical protein